MSTNAPPFIATVIRYGCYPLIRGATAVVLFGELATGRPSFPTELLTVIVALACAALLEGGRPFHSPLSQ
ncbi:Uncharacterised protein [Pseudomonas aeruginosa]|nr:Uncharacterised protein [Pseudomonas aeruginosa]